MTDDLVERVARAMFAAHNDQDCGHDDCFYDAPIWPESDAQDSRSGARAYFLDLAEAAIAECFKPRDMRDAPRDGTRILAIVDGDWRFVMWGKTSHVPLYGFCLADQGPEDFDICEPTGWLPLPPKGAT